MRALIFFFITIMGFSSCGDGLTPLFVMDIEAEVIIPAGLNNLDSHYFIIRGVPSRIANYSNNNTSPVDRIQASNASLEGRIFDIDYSIVDQITIHVLDRNDPNIRKEVFYNNFIPFSEEKELRLLSSLSNVEPMLTQDLVDLEVRIVFQNLYT